jgi:uncharacterized protein (TIRG00374 family)
MPKNLMRPLLISIIAGILLYFAVILATGYQEIFTAFAKLSAPIIALILGLSLVNYALRFIRWHWYTGQQGYQIPMGLHASYYLSGFALTTTPGKIGEAIRSRYLKAHGVSYTHSFATFFVERYLDFCAIVLLSASAVLNFEGYQSLMIFAGVAIIATLGLFKSPITLDFIDGLKTKLSSEKLQSLSQKLHGVIDSSGTLLQWHMMLGGLSIGLLAWGAEGVAFYYILETLEIESTLWLAIGIYSISVVAGAVSFIPGGLGSTEAVMGLLLIALGASPAEAVAATVICRVATLWFAVIIGAFTMGWLEIKRPIDNAV